MLFTRGKTASGSQADRLDMQIRKTMKEMMMMMGERSDGKIRRLLSVAASMPCVDAG